MDFASCFQHSQRICTAKRYRLRSFANARNDDRNSPSLAEGVRGWVNSYLKMTSKTALTILALALFLVPNSLKAEQSGWFIGVQGAYQKTKWQREKDSASNTQTISKNNFYRACRETNNNGNSNIGDSSYDECVNLANNQGKIPVPKDIFDKLTIDSSRNKYVTGGAELLEPYWYDFNIQENDTATQQVILYEPVLQDTFKGISAGFLGGYKFFFTENFGLRFYALVDAGFFKADNKIIEKQMQAYNANFNVDMLYNLFSKDDTSFGVFSGLSAGWVQYMNGASSLGSGISFGVNLGLRFNLNAHHSVELFSKINTLGSFDNVKENNNVVRNVNETVTVSARNNIYLVKTVNGGTTIDRRKDTEVNRFEPATQVGLRYIYNF